MLLKQLNRNDAEKIFVPVQNVQGETMTAGVFVCWDWRNATSHGNAVIKPTTSTIPLFAGVLAGRDLETNTDLPANSFGLVQVYGPNTSVAYNVGAASVSAAGVWLIPQNALYSGQKVNLSAGAFAYTSEALIYSRGAVIMSNDLSGTGFTDAFIRAL